MAITHTIPNFRLVDQLNSPTLDGKIDEDARNNCVPASLASMLSSYTGAIYQPDQLKDAVYGDAYLGGQMGRSYIGYCADQGMKLAAFNVAKSVAGQAQLVATIHREVDANRPVLITIPSQWNSAPSDPKYAPWTPWGYRGPSHCCAVYGTGPGALRLMNPWHGVAMDVSDSWLQNRLLYSEIWLSAKGVAKVAIPSGWKDDGRTLTAPNGVPVVRGFRDWMLAQMLAHGWDAGNVPLKPEVFMAQIEPGNPAMGKGARQDFRFSSLGCQQHSDGSWGAVYAIAVGQDLVALEQQLAGATAQIATLTAQLADAQAQVGDPKAATLVAAVRAVVA